MPAAAAQQAPKRAPRGNGGKGQAEKRPENKKSAKEALNNLPQAAGMAIMALLLVLALLAGNFRALQIASPKAFIRWGDVQSIVEDRADAGENILSVARRLGMSESEIDAAAQALAAFENAEGARAISRADQALTAAMAELTTEELDGEDARSMLRAADTFAEQGSFLRQEARAYNEKAEKAERLYEKLPAKFLLTAPDVYEGI